MRDRADYLSQPDDAPMRVNKPDGSVWLLSKGGKVTIEYPDGSSTSTTLTALTARGVTTAPASR